MATVNRKWSDGMLSSEDWWAVWLGLIMFFAGLMTIWGIDLVGWMTKLNTWELSHLLADFSWSRLLKPASKSYGELHPLFSLFITYLVFAGTDRFDSAATGQATIIMGSGVVVKSSRFDAGESYDVGDALTVKDLGGGEASVTLQAGAEPVLGRVIEVGDGYLVYETLSSGKGN